MSRLLLRTKHLAEFDLARPRLIQRLRRRLGIARSCERFLSRLWVVSAIAACVLAPSVGVSGSRHLVAWTALSLGVALVALVASAAFQLMGDEHACAADQLDAEHRSLTGAARRNEPAPSDRLDRSATFRGL
jgi:hypothetical protein